MFQQTKALTHCCLCQISISVEFSVFVRELISVLMHVFNSCHRVHQWLSVSGAMWTVLIQTHYVDQTMNNKQHSECLSLPTCLQRLCVISLIPMHYSWSAFRAQVFLAGRSCWCRLRIQEHFIPASSRGPVQSKRSVSPCHERRDTAGCKDRSVGSYYGPNRAAALGMFQHWPSHKGVLNSSTAWRILAKRKAIWQKKRV